MKCKHLAISTDRVDYTLKCIQGGSIGAMLYGMTCSEYCKRDDDV